MKNLFILSTLQTVMIFAIQAQPVKDYSYKLDNGITVKTEHCWNQVWVQQTYTAIATDDNTAPLAVNIRTLGDLMSQSSYNLFSAGKEVKMRGAKPGTYELKLTFKLSGKPGTLSLVIGNIIIKSKTKTNIDVTLYDYQILIDEKPASSNSLSLYQTQINRYKQNTTQDIYFGIPSFYAKGDHSKMISPDEQISKTSGRIKPGTYDMLISVVISGQTHKVWLENFLMKPDVNYKIAINLNAGEITYAGGNKQVKAMHLYPAGTAARQTGAPAPAKNLEVASYENVAIMNSCAPGSYDVLLRFGSGAKYEWRKNLVVTTGAKTAVK
jgi:hypothetical protein